MSRVQGQQTPAIDMSHQAEGYQELADQEQEQLGDESDSYDDDYEDEDVPEDEVDHPGNIGLWR